MSLRNSKYYAQALKEIIRDGKGNEETIGVSFVNLLKKKGHIKLLPQILKEFEKFSEKDIDTKQVVLTVARIADENRFKSDALQYITGFDEGHLKTKIDESLVGGFKIETKDIVVDASYKKKLLNLYREIIA